MPILRLHQAKAKNLHNYKKYATKTFGNKLLLGNNQQWGGVMHYHPICPMNSTSQSVLPLRFHSISADKFLFINEQQLHLML